MTVYNRMMNIAVYVMGVVLVCDSFTHGIERGLRVQVIDKRDIEPNKKWIEIKERHKRTTSLRFSSKYIQPVDNNLKTDPGFLEILNKVFESNPREINKDHIQANNSTLEENGDDTDKTHNTGIKNRLNGRNTMIKLFNNYIPTTERVNDISRTSIPFSNEYDYEEPKQPEESTEDRDKVILEIFGTPTQPLTGNTENKSGDSTMKETEYHMKATNSKETLSKIDKNGANAQTLNAYVYFICYILFVLLFNSS